MENTVKERLNRFIEYKGLSKNKFEQICGFSRRYVSNISKSIQPDKIEKISLNFPELNTGWLLTGEGEMLHSHKKDNTVDLKKADGLLITAKDVSELITQNGKLIDLVISLTKT